MTDKHSSPSKNAMSRRHTALVTATKRRSRRRWFIASACITSLVLLCLAAAAWLGAKAQDIGGELQAASQLVPQLQDNVVRNDASAAVQTVKELSIHTARARESATDPLWTIAGALPWVGANFTAAGEVATSADDVAKLAAAPLVRVFQSLEWEKLAPNDKGVDLQPLSAAEPQLASAAHAVRQSSDRLNRIDVGRLLPQVSAPLSKARDQLASLRTDLDAAAHTARLAPQMMGSKAPRRYLLLIQNNAEARASGGIPGALAVLTMDRGKISLDNQSSAAGLGELDPPLPIEPEQLQIYSGRMGKFMQDVNLTPDFPTAARTAVSMWKLKKGDQLDGVISIDPIALSYILGATGPVRISDPNVQNLGLESLPTALDARNVVPTLLSDVYADIQEPAAQDIYFAGVAQEIFKAVSTGKSDAKKLIDALAVGVTEGRVLVWSADSREQALIADYAIGGGIAGHSISPAQFGVYFNDGTGAKMDYYVKRTVQLIKECTDGGYGRVTVRVKSQNMAPLDAASSLPGYVTGGGAFGVRPGHVATNIVAYGPVQSNVDTAVVGGKKSGFAAHSHSGRPVGTVTVNLAPGQSSTVDFTFGKIVQHTVPEVDVTPTVQPNKDVILAPQVARCT